MPLPCAIQSNPFYQPARQWQISIFAERHVIASIEEAFGDLALAISSFELNEDSTEWRTDIITDVPPENADIQGRLALLSGLLGIPTPSCEVRILEAKDWVSEVECSFTPLSIGRFYVHGSHITQALPKARIALRVNAGAAFGSGEHATTSGCLLALSLLAKRRRFRHVLDMGCGSGILAIAAAKLWRSDVIGIDIDPVSIHVARENARHNQVHAFTRFAAGDGYRTALVRAHAPFDLIIANILARPLMKMAPALSANLSPGGIVILSGLLASQEHLVLAAHRLQGLRLVSRICQKGWNTLILKG